MGPLMMSIRPKRIFFLDIFVSGRANSHRLRNILGYDTCDTYTMIGQYHYPHIKVKFCANVYVMYNVSQVVRQKLILNQ